MDTAERKLWRCFHCDEVLSTEVDARNHFGGSQGAEPACLIKAPGEFALLQALRNTEDELTRYRHEDSDVIRAMQHMQADHAQALRREEEKGYSRGLADAREHPKTLGLQRADVPPDDSRLAHDQSETYPERRRFETVQQPPPVTPDESRIRGLILSLQPGSSTFVGGTLRDMVSHVRSWLDSLPRQPDETPAPREKSPWSVALTAEMKREVVVCNACERACCWQGEFMCDHADLAGTKRLTVLELTTKPRGENAEYWFKDGNGVIDHSALEAYRGQLSEEASR